MMFKRLPSLFACLLLLTAAAPRSQDAPVESVLEGEWRNTNNTVHLRVNRCGDGYCGTVVWAIPKARDDARRGSGKDLIGSQLLRELKNTGERKWRGKVYIPDVDATGSATVTLLQQDSILVSGCVFLGLACRSQHWWRMPG